MMIKTLICNGKPNTVEEFRNVIFYLGDVLSFPLTSFHGVNDINKLAVR